MQKVSAGFQTLFILAIGEYRTKQALRSIQENEEKIVFCALQIGNFHFQKLIFNGKYWYRFFNCKLLWFF